MVPFDELRPVGGADERPDLGRIESLLFVIDTLNALPGTAGSIWLSEIRLEAF